jgi:hypothetical protein
VTVLLLLSSAWAAPDRLASTYVAGADISDIVASDDGSLVGWPDAGNGTFTVLDTGTFDPFSLSTCAGSRGAAVTGDATKGWTFFVGCTDGTVKAVDVTTDGDVTLSESTYTVGTGQVEALETDGTTVWAVVRGEDGGLTVEAVTLASGAAVDGFGSALSSEDIEDTTLTSDSLIVAHGQDEVSKVSRTAGTVLTPQSSLGRSLVDAFPYSAGSAVYLADSGGGLVRFESDNDYVPLTVSGDTTTAVGIHPDEGWMVLGAGDDALLYDFDGGTLSEVGTISGAANLTELVVIDGYALGATEDGTVLVLTDRPWVTVESVSPATAVDGDEVTVTFSADIAGDYEVYIGGDVAKAGGERVGSGSVAAGVPESVTFTVGGAAYAEGENRVWVFVDDAGNEGRAAGTLTVDNPPGRVQLDASDVSFGNQSVIVIFDGLTDEDIERYAIFVDVNPFTAADYPVGGPAFTGDDAVDLPLVITAEPGGRVSRTIYPLTNGTTYYVAVRAYDEGELEGPMSNIQTATPQATYCASCLAGEEGGFFPPICGTDVRPAGWLAAAAAGVALLRRRRAAGAVGALLLAGVLALPARAEAAADEDESPRNMNIQLRYGPTTVAEPWIQAVYGDSGHEVLWLEYGFASRFLDINLGAGFFQELGFMQTESGAVSGEHTMFTMVPLALSVTGRVDILDEQPVVPFGRVGLDYWIWRENWYVAADGSTDNERVGGKPGWHFGGGLLLLLDGIDRKAASRLEATTGINDTYVVAEYRKTLLVHGDDQINLSSSEFTFGLKLDF